MTQLIEIVREMAVPRTRLFDAWLDPHTMARFLKPAPGVDVVDVNVDPTENGHFSLTMRVGDTDIPIRGTYLTIIRHERLTFSWLSAQTLASSVVELIFEELGPSHTRLTLTHRGFPDDTSRNNHDGGWRRILDLLTEEALHRR